jgi:hypothetical protein
MSRKNRNFYLHNYIIIGDGINRTLLLRDLGIHWRMHPSEVELHLACAYMVGEE